MPFTKEQLKAYRQTLKEKGVCCSCHKNKTREGMVTCQECQDASTARRVERLAVGELCKYCTRPVYKHKKCEVCYKKYLEYRKESRKRWIEQGRCGKCGGYLDDPTKTECINCAMIAVESRRIRRSIVCW